MRFRFPILFAVLFSFSFCVYSVSAQAAGAEYVPGELLVKFGSPLKGASALRSSSASVSRLQQARAVAAAGGATTLEDFSRIGWQHVKLPANVNVGIAAQLFKMVPGVLDAQPNYINHATAAPNDARFSELWGMQKIHAPKAWNTTTGSSDVVVAVVDTGVDYNHPDLAANMWRNPGESGGGKETNGVDDDGDGYVDDVYGIDAVNNDSNPMDDNEHGTHCAGTIGAVGNNGTGVAGVNWNVKIMALKFIGDGGGTDSDAIKCLQYALALKTRPVNPVNIRVTSNSWGGGPSNAAVKDAFDALGNAGVINITAAGNDGVNSDTTPNYPSGYASDSIVSVAASDQNDQRASFSNYGATSVDLAAPGVDILSTTPNNTYSLLSGTSMATPHVAGAAALKLAQKPNLSVGQLKSLLLSTVDKIPAWNGLVASGGRLNLDNLLRESGGSITDNSQIQVVAPASGSSITNPTRVRAKWSSSNAALTPARVDFTNVWTHSLSYNKTSNISLGSGVTDILSVPDQGDMVSVTGSATFQVVAGGGHTCQVFSPDGAGQGTAFFNVPKNYGNYTVTFSGSAAGKMQGNWKIYIDGPSEDKLISWNIHPAVISPSTLIGSDTDGPDSNGQYSFKWAPSLGSYSVAATAFDAEGYPLAYDVNTNITAVQGTSYGLTLANPASNGTVTGSTVLRATTTSTPTGIAPDHVDFAVQKRSAASFTRTVTVAFPAAGTASSPQVVSNAETITNAAVSFNLNGPPGALEVRLLGSDGTNVLVQNSSSYNVVATYDVSAALAGKSTQQTWTLQVKSLLNNAAGNGQINSWSLNFDGAFATVGSDSDGPDGSGGYTLPWRPTVSGSYNVRATSFNSDDATLATTTNTNITATANRAPVVSDLYKSFSVSGTTFNLSATDADGDTLSYRVLTLPQKGNLRDGSTLIAASALPYTVNGALTYLPAAGTASDSFSFSASDGIDSSQANVFLNENVQTGSALVVNQVDDHYDGSCGVSDCTLREALLAANNLNGSNGNTGVNISFSATAFGAPRKTITLTNDLLIATSAITITGPATGVTIDANHNSSVFYISGATTLSDLNLINGQGGDGGGGGIFVGYGGNLVLNNCTLSGNSAGDKSGGALLAHGSVVLSNCTLTNNSAAGGAAIYSDSSLTIGNSTVANNSATSGSGGISSSGTFSLDNSIVAGNTSGSNSPDIGGTVSNGDYNLVQNANGTTLSGTHNLTGQSPQLGALANNGGPTQTMALLAGSPAIDAGDPAVTAVGQFDQRGSGFPRVLNGRLDIGAYECKPLLSLNIGAASVAEGNTGTGTAESGTNYLRFPLTLSATSSSAVVVSYKTSDGTAVSGSDYIGTSIGSVTIPAGQTTGSVVVPILGDKRFEADETLTVTLTAASNATLGTATATGTITNDDQKPTVSIDSLSQSEGNSGTTAMTFTVSLSVSSDTDTTIPYSTLDGSGATGATAGSDYVGVSGGSVTIPAGQSSATLSIIINGDTSAESDETFSVVLGTPVGNATLSPQSSGVGTLLNDDATATPGATSPANVTVLRSGYQRSRVTNRLMQTVIVQNSSGAAISGPVYMALDSLTGGTLYGAAGSTALTTPVGSPYSTVVLAGRSLPTGSTTIYLEFVTANSSVSFTPRVLVGPGAP